MARWNDLSHMPALWEAVQHWKTNCFFEDGAVFSEQNIWTLENIESLEQRVVQLKLEKDNFWNKYQRQLKGASPETFVLAAEIMWFLRLFPIGYQDGTNRHTKVLVSTKRKNIAKILSWGGIEIPETNFLHTNMLSGVGKPGPAYISNIPYMQVYLIRLLSAWKRFPKSRRKRLLQAEDHTELANFIDDLLISDLYDSGDAEPIRHALLFFLFPDNFERMVSTRHKRQIVSHFRALVSPQTAERLNKATSDQSLLLTDNAIHEIRRKLESAYPHDLVDFYVPPIEMQVMRNDEQIGELVSIEEVERRLTENAHSPSGNDHGDISDSVTEGEQRFYQYFGKNRKSLRKPKLEDFRAQHGELYCECCGERGVRYDASIRDSIFEVHHRKKIADYSDEGEPTGPENLAVLCSNCHNAIHATSTMLEVEEFAEQVRKPKP